MHHMTGNGYDGRRRGMASHGMGLASGVLVAAMSLAGCGGDASGTASPPSTRPATAAGKQCAKGSLRLIGSTAFAPAARVVADAYQRQCPGATISIGGGDSAYGVGQVRQAVASDSPSAASMIGMYDGASTETEGLKPYPGGVIVYSVVAHAGLFPSRNITVAELNKIFTKPGERDKVAVGRRSGSGSRVAFIKSILQRNPGKPDKGNCPSPTGQSVSFASCTEDSTDHLLKFVDGTPNAIGYAEVPGSHDSYPQVSVLSIGGVAPTLANVANGSYKYWIVEHLYASPHPTALAQSFLGFLSNYSGPNLPSDFVPCPDTVKVVGAAC